MNKVYVMGSLRNPEIITVANAIEAAGHLTYAAWHSPGPGADEHWKEHAQGRGRTYLQELEGPHVRMVFNNDKHWLDWANIAPLVLPAGRSAYCELGYMRGKGSRTIALLGEPNPERWDIMLRFAEEIYPTIDDVLKALAK
jgi:hypothetical protein